MLKNIEKNKIYYKLIKNKFDIFVFAVFSIFIYKNNLLFSALNMKSDYLPGANVRREYLIGHIISENPFYLGGAYSGSLTGNHPGPIPYNYPSAIGWLLYDLFPNKVYPFYITYNILYLISLTLIGISYLLIKKIYNNETSSLFLILIMASFIFNNGSAYTTGLPTYFNPGLTQILSIVTIFSLLAQIRYHNLKYTYLTIFVSGLLMQNHLATLLFSTIAMSISLYNLYINKKNVKKIIMIFSLTPWIQTIIRVLTEFESVVDILKYMNYRSDSVSNNRATLINQLPFNSVLQKFNISNARELSNADSYAIIFIIIFLLLPIVNYLILNKSFTLNTKQKNILKTLTLLFQIDIIINLIITKEPHQHNHLAAYSYMFIVVILYLITVKIKQTKTKYIFYLFLSIFILLNNNSKNITLSGNNNLLTTNAIIKLKNSPIKIEKYDHYNMISSGYLDLVYELIINKVDFCLTKPDLNNIKKLFYPNQVKSLTANLGFIEHLYCDKNQENDKNRKAIYLFEDATATLPARIANLSLITRLPNLDNRACNDEYYIFEGIKQKYHDNCGVYNSYPPLIDLSLYIDDLPIDINEQIDNNIYTEKKYDSIDWTNKNCIKTCKNLYLDINQQINSITSIYNYIANEKINFENYEFKISNIISKYKSLYTKLEFIKNIKVNDDGILGYINIYYNEKNDDEKIHLHYNDKDKFKKNKFNCIVNVNKSEEKVFYSYPECNYNDISKINILLNEKIYKKATMTEIYKKIYQNYNGKPLILSNIISVLEKTDTTKTSNINNFKVINYNNKISNKNKLFNNGKNTTSNYEKEYVDKYPIVGISVVINYNDKDMYNSCTANIYQPWYYIIPDYYHIDITECTK
jgi:hypothetical protein